MEQQLILTGPLDVNSYVLWEAGNADCLVVDPGDAGPILAFLKKEDLHCAGVLLTHGHFDHIGGVADIKESTGARIHIHKADASMLHDGSDRFAAQLGIYIRPTKADVCFEGGEDMLLAGMRFRVLATPGHTPGGVCYLFEDDRVMFSGDTLFRLSVGRADLAGGEEALLYRSIEETLFHLAGDYRVCPGHARETTLDFERKHNPFMRAHRENV